MAALLMAGLVLPAGCAQDDAEPERPSPAPTSSPSSAPAETDQSPDYLPAGDLPDPLTLDDVDGRTISARPFADFAVAAGTGVWVSGVRPGAVRYDGTSARITARTRVPGAVVQALESTRAEVLVPSLTPSVLLRLDAVTGEVLARVPLGASPVAESTVGATADGTAYVLVEPSEPRIVVVRGDAVVDEVEAPEGTVAVRAGYGWLWVVTDHATVERRPVAGGEWTSAPTGPSPRFFDLGFGAAWVMNQGDGSVTRADARSGEADTIAVTGLRIGGGDLTVGAGGVWLRTDSAVLRIDPLSREVTHVVELPPGSGSVAAVQGSLWITNHDHLAIHRVPLPLQG
ncbi:hypothetical protein ASG76_00675 [Nocardioides sp. Soil774]|nr:hypothetical protein ASG76_00675 [Nocardioides sp. Soil774]